VNAKEEEFDEEIFSKIVRLEKIMPPPTFRTAGTIAAESFRFRALQIRVDTLILRGVRGVHWLTISWLARHGRELHMVFLRLNGRVTAELYTVIWVTPRSQGRRRTRRRLH
jgi:hypothetical protein